MSTSHMTTKPNNATGCTYIFSESKSTWARAEPAINTNNGCHQVRVLPGCSPAGSVVESLMMSVVPRHR